VLLAEAPPDELVVGTIGRFWRPTGQSTPIAGASEFLAFDTPGYARCALDFRLEDASGDTRVITETRIFTPDADAKRKFGAYWLFVHPGSAFIRRMWRGCPRSGVAPSSRRLERTAHVSSL
jgi:hypothetical protein